MEFDIVHVDSPSSFWVQYPDHEHIRQLKVVESVLEEFGSAKDKMPKLKMVQLKRNHVYIATFAEDDHLYRARIEGCEKLIDESAQLSFKRDLMAPLFLVKV